MDSPEVPIRRVTSGPWLTRTTFPVTTLVRITMGLALRLLKQIGTEEEPGCNSPCCGIKYHIWTVFAYVVSQSNT